MVNKLECEHSTGYTKGSLILWMKWLIVKATGWVLSAGVRSLSVAIQMNPFEQHTTLFIYVFKIFYYKMKFGIILNFHFVNCWDRRGY